jgi:hypothetical protein
MAAQLICAFQTDVDNYATRFGKEKNRFVLIKYSLTNFENL